MVLKLDEDYTEEDFGDMQKTTSESAVHCSQCSEEIGCCDLCEEVIYGEDGIYCKDNKHYHEDCINNHFSED